MINQAKPGESAGELLELLDETIAELVAEIEALRIREQAAPLKLGCAVFGVFSVVVLVLALFATVARPLFGGFLFYFILALVVVLGGLYKILPEIVDRAELSRLARERAEIELTVSELRTQREHIESLARLES
jgi:cell division protein FtsB